jgi:hypothetical protein
MDEVSTDADMADIPSYKVSALLAPKKRGRPRKSLNLSPTKAIKKKCRARKVQILVVQPENRRFTHSYLNEKGFNSRVNYAERFVQRKIPRAKMWLVQADNGHEGESASKGNVAEKPEYIQYPATPIRVMQNVGAQLGIDSAKLIAERLEADPEVTSSSSDDD